MIRSTDIQPDTYKGGAYLRRWSISEASGQAVCVEDAYAIADTEQATLDAQSERNAGIRQALADVEALEAARLVPEPEGDVPKTVTETDIEGNETERPYQPWAEYDAAQVTIAGATDLTNDFEVVRKGKPAETLPVMKTVEETITDEEGNETTRSVEVVDDEAEPTANPEFAEWQAAWTPVNESLNG
jgi:flagellar hook protein FlgE